MQTEAGGVSFTIRGLPSSLAELVEAAGSEEAVVNLALNYYLFHSHFTKVRAAVCRKVEEMTGIKRHRAPAKEGSKAVKYTEPELKYLKRAEEELQDESLEDPKYAELLRATAEAVEVNFKKAARGAGLGGKVAAKWIDMAKEIEKAGRLEAFCERYEISLDTDMDSIYEAVGRKFKVITEERVRQARAELLAI